MQAVARSLLAVSVVALVVTTLAGPAAATRVRVNTLGDAERRVTVTDESNVLLLPSRLVDFPDRVLIDLMEPSVPDVAFGAHFALSETDVLAVWGGARSRLVAGGLALPVAAVRELEGVAAGAAGAVAGVLGDGDATAPPAGSLGGLAAGGTAGAGAGTTGGAAGLGSLGSLKQGALPAGATLSTVAGLRADLQATVLYAHRFEDWRLGVLVGAWADLDEQTKPATEAYERRTTLVEARIGAGFDLGRRSSIDFALVGGYAAFTDEGYDAAAGESVARIQDDGLWQVGAIVVSRLALWRGGAIVPYGEVLYRDQQLTANTALATGKGSFQGIRGTVGVDLSIEPAPGVLIQPGIGFAAEQGVVEWDDDDTRVESLILLLPTYGVGVEAWVLDWLALRLSARQAVRMVTDEWRGLADDTASRRRRTYDVDTRVAFGVGFRFAGFALDLMLNPDIFTSGPYGVTGNELDSLNLQAALLYQW